jgi:hypothetical protein
MQQEWPEIGQGENILRDGTYGRADLHDLRAAKIRPQTPGQVVITASRVAARIEDGASDFSVEDLVWRACGRAAWVTKATNGTFCRCLFDRPGAEGFLSGGCTNLRVEDCTARGTGQGPRWGPSRNDPTKRHGFYDSYASTGTQIVRCVAQERQGAGIHTNGMTDETGDFLTDFVLQDSEIRRCGSEGTGGLQFDCTRQSAVRNILVADCNAGMTFWGNGVTTGQGCADISFEHVTLVGPDGAFVIRLGAQSRGITFTASTFVCGTLPLFEGIEGEEFDPPQFTDCIFFGPSSSDYDSALFTNCQFRRMEEVAGWFQPGTFLPADARTTQGWRPATSTAASGVMRATAQAAPAVPKAA